MKGVQLGGSEMSSLLVTKTTVKVCTSQPGRFYVHIRPNLIAVIKRFNAKRAPQLGSALGPSNMNDYRHVNNTQGMNWCAEVKL